jgi:hypothetical protein
MFNLIKISCPKLRTLSKLRLNYFHDEFSGSEIKKDQTDTQKISGRGSKKFQVFQDADAITILDVEEERMLQEGSANLTEKQISIYDNLRLERKLFFSIHRLSLQF